jgi:hypothetical protein
MFEISLANRLGVEVPKSLSARLDVLLPQLIARDPIAMTRLPLDGHSQVAFTPMAISMGLSSESTLEQAYALWRNGSAAQREAEADAGVAAARRLRSDDGSCRSAAQAATPDLLATAVCAYMLTYQGAPAAGTFTSETGYWFLPVGTDSNTVNLRGLYLGLFLAGAIDDATGLVFGT